MGPAERAGTPTPPLPAGAAAAASPPGSPSAAAAAAAAPAALLASGSPRVAFAALRPSAFAGAAAQPAAATAAPPSPDTAAPPPGADAADADDGGLVARARTDATTASSAWGIMPPSSQGSPGHTRASSLTQQDASAHAAAAAAAAGGAGGAGGAAGAARAAPRGGGGRSTARSGKGGKDSAAGGEGGPWNDDGLGDSDSGCGSISADSDAGVCAICMDLPVGVTVTPCSHGVCVQCALQLTVKGRELPSCPFCRCVRGAQKRALPREVFLDARALALLCAASEIDR